MKDLRITDRRNQALAWGAMLIAVGAVNLIPGAPRGADLLAGGPRRKRPACPGRDGSRLPESELPNA